MTIGKHDFDKDAAVWDEHPARIKLAQDIGAAISEHVPLNTAMNVLDFGCGTGLLTLSLASRVGSITGVDSSRGMLDVLEAKIAKHNTANVGTLLLDLGAGDTLTGNYDMIVSSMTFHHIEKIAPVLNQFHRCLVPGGYLCIVDLDPEYGQFHDDSKAVFHFGFERATLRNALVEANFDSVMFTTAAEVVKSASSGEMRRFPVFLMTALRGERPDLTKL
ncbi:MAG: class I SAM-dependent methyltransferase [Syntrophobacteraceae bacterium]|jgi:ubiquinone/menaquinone biosynthesis C-methylase UbiE